MSETRNPELPAGFSSGPVQGSNLIGEVTEHLHRWLLDGWSAADGPPPRVEEDLSFVPKDREKVVYVYMYRVARNEALMNPKNWKPTIISQGNADLEDDVVYERPPLYLHLYYLLAVHSRFRSEAERLMGWAMMRLNDATHLIYRPHQYLLPSGDVVDSTGQPWQEDAAGEGVEMQKVSLALVDDFTIGDAINFFTINEAPYRPFLTYRAMCAMRGRLLAGPPTTVITRRARPWHTEPPTDRPSGRMSSWRRREDPPGPPQIGPPGYGHRPIEDKESED